MDEVRILEIKQSVFKNNAYHDEWPVAILRDEYFEWKENRGK